jgi:hypothetical protein
MMNHIKRIIIECLLILGVIFVIRGVLPKNPVSEDVDRYHSLKKRIAALPMCECANSANLNLEYTHWCISHPYITVNGKLSEEGDTIYGFEIISVTAEDVVFLCPEGHALKLKSAASDLRDRPKPIPKPEPKVNIGRPLETENEIAPQSTASAIEFNVVYWSPTNIIFTSVDGELYSVGDTVNGFTIMDNRIWFTDPMGDTTVTPFYDSSYYRKSKQSSEVEPDGGDDPQIY